MHVSPSLLLLRSIIMLAVYQDHYDKSNIILSSPRDDFRLGSLQKATTCASFRKKYCYKIDVYILHDIRDTKDME